MHTMKGVENPADALTKYVGKSELQVHIDHVNLTYVVGRHSLNPRTSSDQ